MYKRPVKLFLLHCLLALVLVGCGSSHSNSSNPGPTSIDPSASAKVPSPTLSPTAALTAIAPHATGVIIVVSPGTFATDACGVQTSIIFSATITIASGSTGGSVPFTWNINHTNIAGNATFTAGETSKTVTYTLNNYTVQLNTSPPTGAITVGSSGSTITSSEVGPTGICRLPGPFLVQNIAISVTPATITGIACGATLTVINTATITIAPNSNAGTVQLTWTIGNYSPKTSVFFAPGQTVKTISYTETGQLVAGNTNGFPHHVSLASTSPNAVSSIVIKPTGQCH